MLCMCCFEETTSETLHNASFGLPLFLIFNFKAFLLPGKQTRCSGQGYKPVSLQCSTPRWWEPSHHTSEFFHLPTVDKHTHTSGKHPNVLTHQKGCGGFLHNGISQMCPCKCRDIICCFLDAFLSSHPTTLEPFL